MFVNLCWISSTKTSVSSFYKENNFKLCLIKQLLNVFKLWCERGISDELKFVLWFCDILHYHHIHCGIRLIELKSLNILLWKWILWSNSSLNRFLLTCQCFVTVTICKLAGISAKILRFWWQFSKHLIKKAKQIFISHARRTFQHLTSIKWAWCDSGCITKSLFEIVH